MGQRWRPDWEARSAAGSFGRSWASSQGFEGVVRTATSDDGIDEKLGREDSSKYRAMSARAGYSGVGRPDIQVAVKAARLGMAAPRNADLVCTIHPVRAEDHHYDRGRVRGGACT